MSAFDKVIGYDEIKEELTRYADVLNNTSKYYNFCGIDLTGGILLYGKPGVGKTLLAECFIKESGLKSYIIRKDKSDGDFITHITETFEKASKESKAIIFLDDMEKFANEDKNHKSAEEYVTIQSCMDRYRNDDVFVIATANDIELLPDSLLRSGRLDKRYEILYPEGDDAEKILESFLCNYSLSEDIDIYTLSRLMYDHSCADYKKVVNEAVIRVVFEGRNAITNEDLVKSFYRIMFDSPEKLSFLRPEDKRMVAIHEAGHTVIGEVLRPGSVMAVTIGKYVRDGGVTSSYTPMERPMTPEYCDYRIMRGLGGKAATEIVTGKPDMGCFGDLTGTIDHLSRWIENYCYMGFDIFWHSDQSNRMIEQKEKMISKELERYYQKAKQILIENRKFLDAIVEKLIEKNLLLRSDIDLIKQEIFKDDVKWL